jgi:hypothetical protein
MDQPFVLQRVGTNRRWVLYPPTDPYGDGYISAVRSEIYDDDISAKTNVILAGEDTDLGMFFQRLAATGGAGKAHKSGARSKVR